MRFLFFSSVAFGISMHYSSHNSILLVIHMIPSFLKVECFDIRLSFPWFCSEFAVVTCFVFAAPSTTRYLPEDYVERVKCVHESGGYGSKGYVIMLLFVMHIIKILMKPCFFLSYGYDWKREEAEKNLLRTHTTAVSTRMLYMLAQQVILLLLRFRYFLAHYLSVWWFFYHVRFLFTPYHCVYKVQMLPFDFA